MRYLRSCVKGKMRLQIATGGEQHVAPITLVGPESVVYTLVHNQLTATCKGFAAHVAFIRLLSCNKNTTDDLVS
jgi:hypothetical protein